VERAGLVCAINEAWAMMALAMALALLALLISHLRDQRPHDRHRGGIA